MLPVEYHRVVFTLPAALGPIALQTQREVSSLLFKSAAETLQQIGPTRIWRFEAILVIHRRVFRSYHQQRSAPHGALDPVIRLFEGNVLGRITEVAQGSRNSDRLTWLRTTGYLLGLPDLSAELQIRWSSARTAQRGRYAFTASVTRVEGPIWVCDAFDLSIQVLQMLMVTI